eukprot:TRINITY_DN1807_c1_g1_i1.p1 TRINITY_DN1807_c1_g1~~TRINITY_DN1807_c1_g1_i1.p1  ORF type:complete len:285 (+),score=80.43 TRINITY_DN1807_c1_g1_i1:174-1028(+)
MAQPQPHQQQQDMLQPKKKTGINKLVQNRVDKVTDTLFKALECLAGFMLAKVHYFHLTAGIRVQATAMGFIVGFKVQSESTLEDWAAKWRPDAPAPTPSTSKSGKPKKQSPYAKTIKEAVDAFFDRIAQVRERVMRSFMAELVLGFAVEVPGVFNIEVTLEFSDIQCLFGAAQKPTPQLDSPAKTPPSTAPTPSPAVPPKGDIHKSFAEQQHQYPYQHNGQTQPNQYWAGAPNPQQPWTTTSPPPPHPYSPALPATGQYYPNQYSAAGDPWAQQPSNGWSPRQY